MSTDDQAGSPSRISDPPSRSLPHFLGKTAFELLVVAIGVWAALLAENWREDRERRERAIEVASAISAEITHLNTWYSNWRKGIDEGYAAWQRSYAAGERPPMFYFRFPGAESTPTVGWQVAVESDVFQVFGAPLLFEIGNDYHEWSGIGARTARYMAATEQLVFPVEAGSQGWYDASGRLRPEFAAHLRLMEELLSEWDSKFATMLELRAKVDSAAAAVRR